VRWRALLGDEPRERALAAIREIVRRLPDPDELGSGSDGPNGSLAGGAAGLAVVAAYAGRALDVEFDVAGYLGVAAARLRDDPRGPSLFSGGTGLAWAAEHLGAWLGPDPHVDDPNAEMDEALLEVLEAPWEREFDLVEGLVGFGVYGLERLPRESGLGILQWMLDRLIDRAERLGDGVSWASLASWMLPEHRATYPHRYFNLGLAHGVPGVVAVLSACMRLGIPSDRVLPVLEDAVTWILANRLPDNERSCFPSWVEPGVEPTLARTAWCYGDPGVSLALLQAARGAGRVDWEESAVEIALRAATRPFELTRVADPGFCHGAAGLGHVFDRLWQATRHRAFERAATAWFERTLDMLQPDEPIEDPSLLTGAGGVALALIGAATDIEPAWDRALLCSSAAPGAATA
jgi:hypothetical protein